MLKFSWVPDLQTWNVADEYCFYPITYYHFLMQNGRADSVPCAAAAYQTLSQGGADRFPMLVYLPSHFFSTKKCSQLASYLSQRKNKNIKEFRTLKPNRIYASKCTLGKRDDALKLTRPHFLFFVKKMLKTLKIYICCREKNKDNIGFSTKKNYQNVFLKITIELAPPGANSE